ncbi:MAG: fimbrillin family protein [Bacteroidales bacterium]|nr:fimbrillin family protein [Bacteroidales bacterium]
MKKKLFLGLMAAAAVSFTACQKNEVISEMPQDEAISFNTYLGRGAQTKGTVVETTQLQTQGFGVFAYYTGQTEMEDYSITGAPEFMNNILVNFNQFVTGDWGYETIKYWPNTPGDKISFYAYGPHDNDALNAISVATAADSKPVLTYTVAKEFTKHMDVLFTPAQEDQTKADGAVDMTFYHALSRVGFKVYSDVNYSSTIVLTGVTLRGKFYESGEMNLGTANITTYDHDTDNSTPEIFQKVNNNWTSQTQSGSNVTFIYLTGGTQEVSYAANATAATVVDNDSNGTNDAQYLMIIPQTFGASDKITLTASYTVDGVPNTVSKEMEFTFEAGKAYTFAIKIGLTTVDFSANVVAWDETPGSTEVEIN